MKKQKGITLIALIITIVVLLILAVVTIRAIKGESIIKYAHDARDEYQEGQAAEKDVLGQYEAYIAEQTYSYAGLTIDKNTPGIVEYEPDTVGPGKVYGYGNYLYCETGWVRLKEDAKLENGSYGELCGTVCGIKMTGIHGLFDGKIGLTTAPKIPNTVTSVDNAFSGTGIKQTPYLPASVDSIIETFKDCKSLETVTNIPSKVEFMMATFKGCTNLKTVPTIPESVTDMSETFYNCNSLTGTVTINAKNLKNYGGCFASTGTPSPITLVGETPAAIRKAMSENGHGNITVPDYVRSKNNQYKKYVYVENNNFDWGPLSIIISGTPSTGSTIYYCDTCMEHDGGQHTGLHVVNHTFDNVDTVDGEYIILVDEPGSYRKYKHECDLYDDEVQMNLS